MSILNEIGYKILIVEDAKVSALRLRKILENAGYEVCGVASSREETLSLVESTLPDLILMDIVLSDDDDGIDTIIEIQKRRNIPFVYLSALTDLDTVERAKQTQPHGFIMKPYHPQQVVVVLEMALYKYMADHKLKQSEKKFKAAVSAISDCFIFLDDQSRINYINRATEVLSGYKLEDCFNQPFNDYFIFSDYDMEDEFICFDRLMKAVETRPIEHLLLEVGSGKSIPVGEGNVTKVLDRFEKLKGVVITFRNISDRLKREEMKREMEKRQMAAIIEGQELERSRIARELHDGLGQMLNAIKLQFENFTNEGNMDHRKVGQQMSEYISETIQEANRISENLLPSKLRNFDLSTCIRSLINKRHFNLHITFNSTGVQDIPLEMNKKVNLYRITQELIANCLKHADAKNLSIQLRGEEDSLFLTVEDDGKGFDLERSKEALLHGHLGLQNISDRVNIMNGKIEFDSKINKGSLIIIEVPYESKIYEDENIVG